MAQTKTNFATIIIVILALVLLYALNPTKDDFVAWRSHQAQNQAGGSSNSLLGVMKKGASALGGLMTGAVATGYSRNDYLVCSSYSLGSDTYLGVARLFFKVK